MRRLQAEVTLELSPESNNHEAQQRGQGEGGEHVPIQECDISGWPMFFGSGTAHSGYSKKTSLIKGRCSSERLRAGASIYSVVGNRKQNVKGTECQGTTFEPQDTFKGDPL
jgi:hypothetical protein